uniref:Uncharacterized protein n=1 Tax=Nelumbo nucifera TaxID=4432 RepID=A0A822ZSG0_NELNU|nr:TPA_asm: hypothetical protein HUJ06_018781 [Nelumbo nucifera]
MKNIIFNDIGGKKLPLSAVSPF